MNCQDIAQILDEQEVDRILAEEQSVVQAHLATCAECARDWQIHARLARVEIPEVPAELRALYAARGAGAAEGGSRRRRRFVVIGVVVALAAAAATFTVLQTGSSTPVAANVVVPQVESAATPVSGDALPTAAPDKRAEEVAQPATRTKQNLAEPSVNPVQLRILLLPPRFDSTDKAARPVIEAFHASLLQALRNTPDVVIELAGGAGSVGDQPANRVTVVSPRFTTLTTGSRIYHSGDGQSTWSEFGGTSRGPPRWIVEVMLEPAFQKSPGSNSTVNQYIDGSGNPTGESCNVSGDIYNVDRTTYPRTGGPIRSSALRAVCSSIEGLAARLVAALRPQPEPPAPDLAQFISRLSDASSQDRDRQTALRGLLGRLRQSGVALDDVALDAITAYVASLPPAQRASSLLGFRGIRKPDLIMPLIEFMQHDGDEKVRLEALTTLVRDYSSDSRVRTALENVELKDPSRFVSMAAQWKLSGDAQWQTFVVQTLGNRALPATERFAPALFDAGFANFPEGFERLRSFLGSGDVTSQLLDIFEELRTASRQPEADGSSGRQGFSGAPGLRSGSPPPQDGAMQSVLGLLIITNPAAALDLQIRFLTEDPPPSSVVTSRALTTLIDNRNDPRANRVLDDIAAGKSGPELRFQLERQIAARQ